MIYRPSAKNNPSPSECARSIPIPLFFARLQTYQKKIDYQIFLQKTIREIKLENITKEPK